MYFGRQDRMDGDNEFEVKNVMVLWLGEIDDKHNWTGHPTCISHTNQIAVKSRSVRHLQSRTNPNNAHSLARKVHCWAEKQKMNITKKKTIEISGTCSKLFYMQCIFSLRFVQWQSRFVNELQLKSTATRQNRRREARWRMNWNSLKPEEAEQRLTQTLAQTQRDTMNDTIIETKKTTTKPKPKLIMKRKTFAVLSWLTWCARVKSSTEDTTTSWCCDVCWMLDADCFRVKTCTLNINKPNARW